VLNGNTFTTDVRINPGTAVNVVDVTLSYDATKVSYQSISAAGTPFVTPFIGGVTTTSNSIHFTNGILGGSVSADAYVATVTFKAIAGSGTTALSLTGSNAADATTSAATDPAVAGATITLTSPVATCPAGQTGTPPNCVTPTPTPTPTPPTTTTKTSGGGTTVPIPTAPTPVTAANTDIATTVTSRDVQYTFANFVISSKSPTQIYIRYGLDPASLSVQTGLSELATSHTISLDPSTLLPGQTYYYQVISKNSQGLTVQAEVASFSTKGLTVKVGFYDKNNKPLVKKKVSIHSTPQEVVTDSKGIATFTNLTPGNHTVSYVAGGKTYSRPLALENNIQTDGTIQTAEPQTFSVVFDFVQSSGIFSPTGLGLLGVAVIVIVAVAFYLRRNNNGMGSFGDYIPTLNPVTVGDADTSPSNKGPINEELTKRLESTPMPQSSAPGTVISSQQHKDPDRKN
jgi:hypothetical protein